MLFFELFVPKRTLDRADRTAERIVAEVMQAGDDAPPAAHELAAAAREQSWAVVHELDGWSGAGVAPALVRFTVPAGTMSDAKRAHVRERVARVLPDATVHVVELPDAALPARVALAS